MENTNLFKNKIKLFFKSVLKKISIYKKDRISFIEIPIFYFPSFFKKYCLRLNEFIISQIINKFKIKIILNSSFEWIPINKNKDIFYIYDLVDDVLDNNTQKKFIEREIKKSNIVITITELLKEKINIQSKKISVIPNGTNIQKFRDINNKEEILKIKKKYKIPNNKKIVGFIGYFEEWTGISFLYELFQKWKQNDFILLLIGDGPAVRKDIKNRNVLHIGFQPPHKIQYFFQLIDVGTLPFKRSEFTDNSLPIKIIEYGVSQKLVITSDLKILRTLKFPNVSLLDLNIELWKEELLNLKNKEFYKKWDKIYDNYDWNLIIKKFYNIIENETSHNIRN